MKKYLLIIVSIILSAVIVVPRFYHLASQPPGLHIDEVSFAADAKAIAETGRDTWNLPWPLVFKAFGEWKAPGLVYTMAFWTKVLGVMNNTVTRLPSALAGLTILVFFGLTLRLLLPQAPLFIIIFSVFVLSFSPWHFDMSRIFYEAFSALAFFTISLYFMTKATLKDSKNLKLWYLAAIFAGLSGYFYASVRYIVIAGLMIAVILQPWSLKLKIKHGLLVLITLLLVGIGWVGDLVSSKGLNRLYYYESKSSQGATLEIDEKRQYCFLSMDRDLAKSKPCYYVWNKPILKATNATKAMFTYLGSDYLFIKATSEFGFDSEYGAYLFPMLPLYLIGLFIVLAASINYLHFVFKPKTKITERDRVYALYIITAVISLIPSAVANNVNMRMGLLSLYIVGIIIGIGIYYAYHFIQSNLPRLSWLIYLGFSLVMGFFILQSSLHYFLVFTHSNDLMWTSDAGDIFGYVKSVSPQYDHIIDAELHGPLAPYFYGDITTQDVQSGTHSVPDTFGFTYLTSAGKYELRHVDVRDLACEKLAHNDHRKMLVITAPVPSLSSISKYSGRSWSGALLLHEVYDVDDIIAHESKQNASFVQNCGPK